MALIGMAVHSTTENQKEECLRRTLQSLKRTVDFTRHRLHLSVNSSTVKTELILMEFDPIIERVIYNDRNIGTAEAINKVWQDRKQGEHAIKMDDDIVINTDIDWIGLMETIIANDSLVGQVGLKRKDCRENPNDPDPFYRSKEYQIAGIEVEECSHIMGSCVMHSDRLLNEVGYLWQPELYGFDDALMSRRSKLAGFKNLFLPCKTVDIDHVDEGKTPYQGWKEKHSMQDNWANYERAAKEYDLGSRDIYYNPFL